MIDGLKPYPAAKPSGVEGIGDIPAHWKVVLNQRILKEKIRPHNGQPETQLSLSQRQGLVPTSVMEEGSLQTATFENWKVTVPGDLVLNRFKAHLGVFFASTLRGIVSFHYGVFAPRAPLNPKYFEILYHTPAYRSIYAGRSNGMTVGLQNLSNQNFYNVHSIVPPIEEQAAIVRFIDQVDHRIRKYIAAKRKLIALLNEQKQAIIHRAVTRGVSHNLRCQQTGEAWFPELPNGWELLPLRRVISRAVDGPHHSPQYVDEGVMFISARNIKPDRWSLSDAKYISNSDYLEFSRRIRPEPGDVLYTKGGTTGVARAVDLDFPFQVWVHVAVLKPILRRIDPFYLALALNSPRCYEQSQLLTKGATNQDLGLGRMKSIMLPVPPLEEQARIVKAVDIELSTIRDALATAEHHVGLLREYRTALVAAVVTGKVDVRKLAEGLSEIRSGEWEPNEELDNLALEDIEPEEAVA